MKRWVLSAFLAVASCAGTLEPAEIAIGRDLCASCRMAIISQATAAQIAAPGEEPRFFDDIACLRDYLRAAAPPDGAVIYVADHRTGAWVDARTAVFTDVPVTAEYTTTSTPMASGLLAHANISSRDADPAARGGDPVLASAILASPVRSITP